MLKNHIKLSLRNLWKNKLLSTLNLLGLSIGIGSVLTLLFSVYAYYTANENINDRENIYYLKTINTNGDAYREVAYPLLDEIIKSSPEVIAGTHLHGWGDLWLEYGESELQERTDYADAEFFKVFSLPLKYGDSRTALNKKHSIILTDRVSQKIFGSMNPIGETIMANDSLSLTVTGVLEPISPYASFRLGVLLSNELLEDNPRFKENSGWDNTFSLSYLRVRSDSDMDQLESRIKQLVQKNYTDPSVIADIKATPFADFRMEVIPVGETIIGGNIATSFFVLLIVLVNLLNLNASTLFSRSKDIAVRKILGGSKKSIVAQFCLENGILVFVSILMSGGLFLGVLLPKMNDIFGPDFGKITFNIENDYPVPFYVIGLGIMVTLVVGIIPILRFISVPISAGIKGKLESIKSDFFFRNSFITLQFIIAIFFICVAIILNSQIGFMKSADLGFNIDNVIVGNIDLDYKDLKTASSNFNTLLDELNSNPYVNSVSVSDAIPSQYNFNYTDFYDPGTDRTVRTRYSHCDDGYLKTLEIPVVIGRDFHENLDSPEGNSVIINRSAMKALGWKTIEGKRLKYKNDSTFGHLVVGVMEDFHYQDMQNAVEPLLHFYRNKKDLGTSRFLSLRVNEGQEKVIKDIMTSTFAKMDSRKNYEHVFLSDKVSGQYRLIEGMLKTVNVVALLTIFISCLGVFGLISLMAQRRIKEIGIRKVLGASAFKIIVLLSKDYIIILGLAALIAFPLSWLTMNEFLANFAYSVTMQWWMFALGGLLAFLITSFTLGIQAVRSANANPVESLRAE